MTLPANLAARMKLPVIASPMFIVSQTELVLAECRAGIVGAFPSLNARGEGEFERWLIRLNEELTGEDAPFAVNLIVHRSNPRLDEDLALCVKYKVPIVITSLGAQVHVNEAIHSYGGIVLHDVIDNRFAKKAIEKGADGLIAVAAGAGGHAGTLSPFALMQEIRQWFDGPVALSGSIASGSAVLAAQAMGADLAYIGSAFIATEEAVAVAEYKQMIVDSAASDILYTDHFTGVHGNYLRPSITRAGLDPDNLGTKADMDFGAAVEPGAKAWKDIWGCGQGIGAIGAVVPAAERVAQLAREYAEAKRRLCGQG
ncbi:nitronate monooxygenase family protein [Croceicoccus sp. BE223]|uniref:NAD(P)H-dependent flavin oxidoreductase n=1 Tax=Croceicoccus sp. BE223 TaxID=2817716 RepID=UPI0028553876|nr:nitronate monooxygenase family protein [Croceicoccus sp. BE223]MDR7102596.1 nitronate monooxygenase [Croceicoccus sp. BE223]